MTHVIKNGSVWIHLWFTPPQHDWLNFDIPGTGDGAAHLELAFLVRVELILIL